MKKLLATSLISAAVVITANAQGTVKFQNYYYGTANDPTIHFADWTLAYGSQYVIALFGGPSSGSMSLITTTGFYPGAPGYFVGPSVAVPGVSGGTPGYFMVAAWDATVNGTTTGATYEQAWTYSLAGHPNMCGHSTIFSVVTGNPAATPPGLPADLVPGLTAFGLFNQPLPMPEPSTLVLVGLATATMALTRRRH